MEKEFILITSANFPSGGAAANYLNLFCKGLKENKKNISVWLLKGFAFGSKKVNKRRKNISSDGISYIYLCAANRPLAMLNRIRDEMISFFRLIYYLLKLTNKRKSTSILLYNSELFFNITIFIISKLLRINIISFVSEFRDKSDYNTSFLRKLKWYGYLFNVYFLYRKSSQLIVFSSYLKELYIRQGVYPEKIIVQPNLTDFDIWRTDEKPIKYTLGYSGTPTIKDGIIDLFEAISVLRENNIEITLLLIGDRLFGESLIPKLKEIAKTLNIADLITFTGLVATEEVKYYLAECKILTLTRPDIIQTQAGFPTKLGEYFASGKQILVTNFGDINKYFIPSKEIVTANCGNIEDIAQKITWILENPVESETIRQKGYLKAKEILAYQTNVKRILTRL